MVRKWLIILLVLFVVSLGLISQAKAKPANSLRLALSPYAKYAKWINAMARYESGDYSNTLTKEANNIYSMGFPSQRPAVNIGSFALPGAGIDEPPLFSKYKNYDQATQDLLLWFKYNKFPTNIGSVESFVHALKDKKYFALDAQSYLAGLKSKL